MKYLILIMGFVTCDSKNQKLNEFTCPEHLYFDEGWQNTHLQFLKAYELLI